MIRAMSAAPVRLPLWVLPCLLGLVLTTTLLGYKVWLLSTQDLPADSMTVFRRVYHQVMEHHLQPQDGSELILNATSGLVDGLDEYSEFIPARRVQRFEEETIGTYQGIGFLMVRDQAPVTVLFPFPGGPAATAGVQVGDRILAVDGETIELEPRRTILERARKRILGPPGSSVRLTVSRDDGAPSFEVVVERAKVHPPSVQWTRFVDAENGIGYLHVSDFQKDTTEEFDAEIAWLQQQTDTPLRALIVDLRNNTGGLLEECLPLTNRFVANGTLMAVRARDGIRTRHEADPKLCTLPDLPLVILQNASSASSSEVMTGALQDHGRAVVVGERSYGKGMVQSIFTWRDLDIRLKLTTQQYETPKGRNLEGRRPRNGGEQKGGIEPDRRIELTRDAETAVFAVLGTEIEVPRPFRDTARALSDRLGSPWPTPVGPDVDLQLAEAIAAAREAVAARPR
jgi:carboxyl-terminal processing protease